MSLGASGAWGPDDWNTSPGGVLMGSSPRGFRQGAGVTPSLSFQGGFWNESRE